MKHTAFQCLSACCVQLLPVLNSQGPVMVASPYGGVNIEEVAKTSPSYIYKDAVDITTGMCHLLSRFILQSEAQIS